MAKTQPNMFWIIEVPRNRESPTRYFADRSRGNGREWQADRQFARTFTRSDADNTMAGFWSRDGYAVVPVVKPQSGIIEIRSNKIVREEPKAVALVTARQAGKTRAVTEELKRLHAVVATREAAARTATKKKPVAKKPAAKKTAAKRPSPARARASRG